MIKSSSSCQCIASLFDRISKLRKHDFVVDHDNFSIITHNDKHAWAKIFAEYFVCGAHCNIPHCSSKADDMLWYVRPQLSIYDQMVSGKPTDVEVYRRQSRKQPSPGDNAVDWEETVYLNLVLHHIEYTLTCCVCTKTSPQNLQILKKNTQRVYPSPSRRKMDSKGEREELVYPNVFFTVDGFEEVFSDMVVRDGECVCVELVAKERSNNRECTLFLGSIRYEVLKQVYDSKASSGWGWARMLSSSSRRLEFVRMRGPHGKGHAEMAITRLEIPGYVTPTTEDFNFDDFEVEAAEQYRKRRVSESNLSAWWNYSGGGRGSKNASKPKKFHSEADYMNQYPEVEATSIDDELEESVFGRLWGMRGFGQAWHWLREKRRATSTPLNAYLTYVTLPCQTILEGSIRPRPTYCPIPIELELQRAQFLLAERCHIVRKWSKLAAAVPRDSFFCLDVFEKQKHPVLSFEVSPDQS